MSVDVVSDIYPPSRPPTRELTALGPPFPPKDARATAAWAAEALRPGSFPLMDEREAIGPPVPL